MKGAAVVVEQTDEARLRTAFADAVRAVHAWAMDESRFRIAVCAAAGALVCRVARDSGMSREAVLELMDGLWEDGSRKSTKEGN
jgi:hypothetical protein